MALILYTVTVIDHVNNPNNTLANTDIVIRTTQSGSPLAIIYADEDGLIPIPQPGAKTNDLGVFEFYAASANYNFTATVNGETIKIGGVNASSVMTESGGSVQDFIDAYTHRGSLTNLTQTENVIQVVTSYRAGVGKGGGNFIWSASTPKSYHNGITVIDLDRPFPTDWNDASQVSAWYQSSQSGDGCFLRQGNDTVTAYECGGLDIGLSDIPEPMQHAYNSALRAGLTLLFPVTDVDNVFPTTRPILIDDYNQVNLQLGTHVRNFSITGVDVTDFLDTLVFKDNINDTERLTTSNYNSLSSTRLPLTQPYTETSKKIYCNTSGFSVGDFVQVEGTDFGGAFGIANKQFIDRISKIETGYLVIENGAKINISPATVRNLTVAGKRFVISPKIIGGGKISSSYYVGDGQFGAVCNVECYRGEFDFYQESGIGFSANNVHHSNVNVSGVSEYTGVEFAFLSTGSIATGFVECREGFVTDSFGYNGNRSSVGFMLAEGATDCRIDGSTNGRFYTASQSKFQTNGSDIKLIANGYDYAACIVDVNHEGYTIDVSAVSSEPESVGVLIGASGRGVITKADCDVKKFPLALNQTTNLNVITGNLKSRDNLPNIRFAVDDLTKGVTDYGVKVADAVMSNSLSDFVKSSLTLVDVGVAYTTLDTINLQPYAITNNDGVVAVDILAATVNSGASQIKFTLGTLVYESPTFSSADGVIKLSLIFGISSGTGFSGLASGVALFNKSGVTTQSGIDSGGNPIMNFAGGAAIIVEGKGDSASSKIRLDLFKLDSDRMIPHYFLS